MAHSKRKRWVPSTAPGLLCSLGWLRRVRSRRRACPAPPPPQPSSSDSSSDATGTRPCSPQPSPSDSPSSTSSEATGTRPSYPRFLVRGTRSIKQPKPWTCGACGFVNELVHHLLFDLPAFKCKADPPEGSADFGFCYGDLAVNGFCPIGNVKEQNGPTCVANTLSCAVEVTHRVMKIVLEEPLSKEEPIVDVDDLLKKYKIWCGEDFESSVKFGVHSLIIMLRLLEKDGVKDMESDDLYRIHDWDYIDEGDFAALSFALADGYPLITGFKTGKRIFELQPGDLYMPPKLDSVSLDGKRKPEEHMALLVGAQQEQKKRLFYFLSSWSEEFCSSMIEGDGIIGGIGAIRAEGIDFSPVQILRFSERSKQEVHHPDYPSLHDV